MLNRHLFRSASLVLVVATLAACGQEDLTVAVAEDAAGESMGVPAVAEETPVAPEDAPAPIAADTPVVAEVAPEVAAEVAPDVAPEESAPASALEAAAAAAAAADTAETVPAGDSDDSGGSGDSDGSGETGEESPLTRPMADQPIGDLSDTSEQPALPPVDEPEAPPTEATGGEATAAAEDESNLPSEDEWTPPPVEDPKLVDGVWRVSFDYLGSFDTGMLALPEDSPMAIEARREQQFLAEKSNPSPTGLPPESDDIPIAPATEIGFPDAVRKMDGEVVRIEGYMIPLKFEDGKVKSFFLSRYMMGCCFGVLPKANEIIEVEMAEGKGAFYDAYMPFIVEGKFVIVEDGTDPEYMQSVFRMTADSCDYSEDW